MSDPASAVDSGQDLAYRARALAQAHSLTAAARRYMDAILEQQRSSQPMPEVSVWARMALLNGYCVRQVEEADAGIDPAALSVSPTVAALEPLVAQAAADVRAGTAGRFRLGAEARTIDALDRIVASEVDRRLDHLRDEIDADAWTELSDYLAWWVVTGYAVRVAETDTVHSDP